MLFLGGAISSSSRHSSSTSETKLLYHCALLGLEGFEGSCRRFKSLLKLRLRLIGCRPRFITAGNSALLLISDPIFRRKEAFRSNLPLDPTASPIRSEPGTMSSLRRSAGFLPDSTEEKEFCMPFFQGNSIEWLKGESYFLG